VPTEKLYLDDSYLRSFDAAVVAAEDGSVALDRTAFYARGGGQPHDVGTLSGADVVEVVSDGDLVWHRLAPGGPSFALGDEVHGEVDWTRRHECMRTHTAMHLLCGVIWNEYRVAVTGGNMEPLSGRMDFEFGPVPDDFREVVTQAINDEIAADRPIVVSYLPREEAVLDESLIRTKVSLIPESVSRIRVVDIVGLDKQADGGTHVASTREVGRVEITKVESKGKANKRVRLAVLDA
jgi:misacylated tRNA(Ala) deacylase